MTPHGFSEKVEGLRLAWDASCLSAYMRDPLAYYWRYVLGYKTPHTNPTLSWGTVWHEAAGEFDRALFEGADRETALMRAIRRGVALGFDMELPARGDKGDAAKRNIYTLARALIWWEVETRDRVWPAARGADGTPAIEVRFLLPLGAHAATGEEYMLCGSFDEVIELDGDYWTLERKTTTKTLGPYFWPTYDPCMQTYLYDYVAPQLYPDKRFRGVIVEALQTGVEFARTDTHRIVRTDAQRLHWREVMLYWIRRAEQDALHKTWVNAMNSECTAFASTYKDIQRRDPRVWDALLKTDLERAELWNPARMQ